MFIFELNLTRLSQFEADLLWRKLQRQYRTCLGSLDKRNNLFVVVMPLESRQVQTI